MGQLIGDMKIESGEEREKGRENKENGAECIGRRWSKSRRGRRNME